jgi:hypothetical protein
MSIKTLSTIAIVLCCLGCKPSTPTEKLVGKWRLDVECTIEQDPEVQNLVNLHKLSRIDMQQLHRFVAPTFDTFSFEFERDGGLSIKRNQVVDEYDYTITAPTDDAGLLLSISPKPPSAKQRVSARFDGDKLNLKIRETTYCLVEL